MLSHKKTAQRYLKKYSCTNISKWINIICFLHYPKWYVIYDYCKCMDVLAGIC